MGRRNRDEIAVILLADGFAVTALLLDEQLRKHGIDVRLVAIKAGPSTSEGGFRLEADLTLSEWDLRTAGPELIVLPGGACCGANLLADPRVGAFIRTAMQKGAWLATTPQVIQLMQNYGLTDALPPARLLLHSAEKMGEASETILAAAFNQVPSAAPLDTCRPAAAP